MTVYVEYAFCDNFTMDFLLLFCAAVTLKISFKWWRIALGALVGTLCAMSSVFLAGIWLFLCKTLCLFAMCAVAVGIGKKLFWHILLTLAYTFVTGGAIVGIFNMLQVSYSVENGLCYNMPVPLFVYILAVCVTVALCYCILVFFKQHKNMASKLKKVQLVLHKTHTLWGFCDSGNTVQCNGLPVCFATKQLKCVSEFFAEKVLLGQTCKVQIATLTGQTELLAVQTLLQVDGAWQDIFLALPAQKCNTQYELLLSCQFC